MAEERTVSRFTKLNSKDRSRQKPATLVRMTQIQQHLKRTQLQDDGQVSDLARQILFA